jgi:hypothetical protein
MADAPRETAFDRVDSACLDCVEVNLAALLQHAGVADVRSPFARDWHFALGADGLPVLRAESVEQAILGDTGWEVVWERCDPARSADVCRGHLAAGRPVLVLGDAHRMSWLPYFGHEHQEHSFLVDGAGAGELRVADAYANRTEWGDAVPTRTTVDAGELEGIVASLDGPRRGCYAVLVRAGDPAPPEARDVLWANARAILRTVGESDAVAAFAREHAERAADVAAMRRFTLGCWLTARARALHSAWLAGLDGLPAELVERFTVEVARGWQHAQELSYVTLQRVARGRAAPTGCFDLVESRVGPAEVAAAERLLVWLDTP